MVKKQSKKLPVYIQEGIIQKNRQGFAFLIFDDSAWKDYFLPPQKAKEFFQGDRVRAWVNPRGHVVRLVLLKHTVQYMIGRYFLSKRGRELHQDWFVYEKKSSYEKVRISKKGSCQLHEGDWIRVRLKFQDQRQSQSRVTAEVIQVYGPSLEASTDFDHLCTEFGLQEQHSDRALLQAKQWGQEIPEIEYQKRQDLTHLPWVTIDGQDARDFDDAIFVQKVAKGFCLWVGIADVSYYVTSGSPLDCEAYQRATSVYFPERALHMLPQALSEDLCSLQPGKHRLALVAKMNFDGRGVLKKTDLIEAIICSQKRWTYEEMNQAWSQYQNQPDWFFQPHIELYKKLKNLRIKRGSIDFDLPEAEVKTTLTGEVLMIQKRERLLAHRLIEEFMIAANEAVTCWMMSRRRSFIYRIHEEPTLEAFKKFQKLAETVGIKMSLKKKNPSSQQVARWMSSWKDHPAHFLLQQMLLRSMKQARYSPECYIHYGLASPAYTHFTSPIRRYPDLVVHRLLRYALQGKPDSKQELVSVCDHCSAQERVAIAVEREAIKLKQVRLMSDYLGKEFDAQVVGMIDSGFFVQLHQPFVEGFVSLESLCGDRYQFQEERMQVVGLRRVKKIHLGDRCRVQLVRTDLQKRQIDFRLVESI